MSTDIIELERRALELAKQADFGPEAIRVNAAIAEHAPRNESVWTRLGRCHLEQRNWDEAVTALRTALSLNPSSTVATNLLGEVRKRRALTPTASQRVTTGFAAREFAMLETLSPAEVTQALRPRIEALFDAVNASTIAARIVEIRQRHGASGSKLFHANSFHSSSTGHIFAFHHGGRWEPQFSIGWFSSPPLDASCVRIGLGFNLSTAGRDPDRVEGQEQILAFFERFQQTLQKSWKQELVRWMGANTGFIQYADHPPAVDVLPERAVEWLLTCRNAAALEWIFVGRWLFLDNPEAAKILGDRAKLASVVDDTFRTLYPLWLGTYATPSRD
jgi:tetratricopeptide (TPR) repeat protein